MNFNPTANALVDQIKKRSPELIDLWEQLKAERLPLWHISAACL
jgi:hypothetical protein